jgi:hypothetical protein
MDGFRGGANAKATNSDVNLVPDNVMEFAVLNVYFLDVGHHG